MTNFADFYNQRKPRLSNIDVDAKVAVFAIGRFNPPTQGHMKLINAVQKLAEMRNGDHFIFPSHSVDRPSKRTGKVNPNASKNPLPFDIKLGFMREMFPGANIVEDGPSNPWDLPKWLGDRGYTDIIMVAGSDQMNDFTRLAESAKQYFNGFDVVNAGIRNPDASDWTGMSATKARQAALLGDIGKFRAATGWSGEQAQRLMEATRICMGVE